MRPYKKLLARTLLFSVAATVPALAGQTITQNGSNVHATSSQTIGKTTGNIATATTTVTVNGNTTSVVKSTVNGKTTTTVTANGKAVPPPYTTGLPAGTTVTVNSGLISVSVSP